jgi:hypothetical protein
VRDRYLVGMLAPKRQELSPEEFDELPQVRTATGGSAPTAEAFQTIKCKKAAAAVTKTLALFPDSRPQADVGERLRHYLESIPAWPTDMELQFFRARDDVTRCLAAYVRTHREAFRQLGRSPRRRAAEKKGNPACKEPRESQKSGATTDDLPHWARVAFTARCARQVYPLLAEYWPSIPARRARAVLTAIDLADQSASEGRPADGLGDAVAGAVATAGSALATRAELRKGEPAPPTPIRGRRPRSWPAAGKATRCALASPDESILPALEAEDYSRKVASAAGQEGITEGL